MKAAWIWGIAALWAVSACGSVADDSDGGVSIDAPDNGIDAAGGIPDAGPTSDAAWECISNFDCDDKRRCTTDSCTLDHKCLHDELDGVAVPGAIQDVGDCQLLSCVSGAEMSVADNADVPFDALECTQDVCTGGVPSNPPEPSTTACSAGMCDGDGNCVGCTTAGDCGADTFCRTYTCGSGGVCGFTNTPNGTVLPPAMQTPGDCRRLVCNGSGGVREEPLDSDIPADDGLECTFETCFMGAPLHPPKAINTPCSTGFCDGDGACVECNNATQCGTAPVCFVPLCESHMCDVDQADPGTPAPPEVQTPFDCQLEVCDGLGGHSPIPDDTDLPFDGRECTNDTCVGGTAVFTNKPIHTACTEFGGVACNGEGDCVECTMNSHCSGTVGCDTDTWTCKCPDAECGGLDCDGDGVGECDPDVPFCCVGAGCAIQHVNGLGEKWYDCVPLGTYNEEQAREACQAHFPGDPTACNTIFGACGGGSGGDGGIVFPPMDAGTGTGDLVCGMGMLGTCACWQFSGVLAGRVVQSAGCGCPSVGDLGWN